MKQNKTNENYKKIEYPVGRAGITTLYLESKDYKHEHVDGEISHHNLSIGLSHIYESQNKDENQNGMGKGWRSNLHQYLVKKPYDFQRKRKEIIYTDGNGKEHTIYEKWSYEDENNQKVYIRGEDVFIDGDGKLKTKKLDQFYEVKMECDSDENLILVLGASLSNHPSQMNYEESYQLSIEFSDGYRKNLLWLGIGEGKVSVPIYYFINSNGEKIYLTYSDLVYGDGSVIKNTAGDVMTLEGNERKELKFDEQGCYFDYPTYNGNVKIYPIPSMKYAISHNKKIEDVYLNEDIQQIDSQIEQLESNFKSYALQLNDRKINMSMIDYQNSVKENIGIDNYEKKVKSARNAITNALSDPLNKGPLNRQKAYDTAIDNFEKAQKQVNTIIENKQKEIQFEALDHNIYDFVKAKVRLEEVKAKRQTLIEEQRKQVNDFIVDGEGNTLGFDGYGRLILIQDKEENKIQIEYGYEKENEGKILSIYSDTESIRFDYNKATGLLNSIIDPQGRKTKYSYNDNENLVSITYNDQKETKFEYEKGFSASSPMLEKLEIVLQGKEYKIKGYCFDGEIKENTVFSENEKSKTVFEHRYIFDETSVLFKDELLGNTAQYIFEHGDCTFLKVNNNEVYSALYTTEGPISEVIYNTQDEYSVLTQNTMWPEPVTYYMRPELEESLSSRNLAVKVELSNDLVKGLKEYAFELILRYENKTLSHTFYNMHTFILPFYVDALRFSEVLVELNPIQMGTFDVTKSIGTCYLITPKNETQYFYSNNGIALKKTEDELIEYLDYDEDDLCHHVKTIDKYKEEVNTYYSYNANKQLMLVEDSKGNIEEYTYDEKGNCIEKRSFNKKDASLVKIEKLNSETDEKDKVFTQYDKNTGELLSISSSSKGMNNATSFTYNYGLLTSMMHHGMKVNYAYDGQGRKTSVSLNGSTYVTTTYADNCDRKIVEKGIILEHATEVISTYKNKYKIESLYDKEGQLRKQNLNDETSIVYDYDKKNRLIQTTYSDDTPNESITYEDDKIKKVTKGNYTKSYTYDKKDRILLEQEKENQNPLNDKTYFYEDNEKITKVLINEMPIFYQYDVFNRVTHQEINHKKVGLCHEYSYLQKDGGTQDFIAQDFVKVNTASGLVTETYNYEYDDKGNIISIDTDDKLTRYQYDSLNRLVREDNPQLKKTMVYKYDTGGNILLRKTYDYSLEDKLFSPTVDEYAYSCNNWKDQLISFNGKTFVYDTMGRPTTYKDTKMTWNKNGTLASIGNNITYTYNANGIRTKKVVDGVETTFLLDGTRIVKSTTNNVELIYRYVLNKLVGFCYNNIEFIYERNILGDIIRIYNSETGEIVGEYAYDGYGNQSIIKDVDGMATLNPFRYRGYFFDSESNLFYLNSRYYDPEVGRFISPDIISILDETRGQINGLNLYMYCADNPISYVDPSGCFPVLACIFGLAALVGMGLTIGGVASDNNIMTAIGLTMIAIPALISGGMALYCAGAAGTMAIGGVTVVAGVMTGLFASAEYQEAFTDNNWMSGVLGEDLYNGLLLATAAIATMGTIASMAGVARYQNFGKSNWHGGWKKMRSHYLKHGRKQMGYRNVFDYTNGAKAIINNGSVYASKVNAYVQWIAGNKYFYVGIGHNSNLITTFFIKTITYTKYISIL